jgi:hypothetical protein
MKQSAFAPFLLLAACLALAAEPPKSDPSTLGPCPVTLPPSDDVYGNEALQVGLWPEGMVIFKPDGPGGELADGALFMKFWWCRGAAVARVSAGWVRARRFSGDRPDISNSRMLGGHRTLGRRQPYFCHVGGEDRRWPRSVGRCMMFSADVMSNYAMQRSALVVTPPAGTASGAPTARRR